MICPNCDGILNIRGCLSCGWQHGDPWPEHRLMIDSVHPLKLGMEYPSRSGAPLMLKNYGQLVLAPEPVEIKPPVEVPLQGSVKIHDYGSGDWAFHCVGCGFDHSFRVNDNKKRPQWNWNGSLVSPTFTPSLLVNGHDDAARCHSFVTDGKIQYLTDSFHQFKGMTIDLPDWDTGVAEEGASQKGGDPASAVGDVPEIPEPSNGMVQ